MPTRERQTIFPILEEADGQKIADGKPKSIVNQHREGEALIFFQQKEGDNTTKQMSKAALITNGYKKVAEYKKFDRIYRDIWNVYTAVCYQKENECIIKLITNNKRCFTLCYQDKNKANSKIKELLAMGYKKQGT